MIYCVMTDGCESKQKNKKKTFAVGVATIARIFILSIFTWVKINIFHTEINHTRQSWLLCASFIVLIQSRCAQLQNHFTTKNPSIDGTVRKSISSFQEFS